MAQPHQGLYAFDIPFLFQGLTLRKPFPAVRLPDTFRKQQPRLQEAKVNTGTTRWSLVLLDIPAFSLFMLSLPWDRTFRIVLLHAYCTTCTSTLRHIIQITMHIINLSLHYLSFSLSLICPFTTFRTCTLGCSQYARGSRLPRNTAQEVRTLSTVRHPELIALYGSAPNHVLGQMLGCPAPMPWYLTFRYIG